ncbi:MAG: hypothetical protein H7233_04175, partial [Pseudorhodobacter sp.]|nr:hypothetical protein [Frankiaceae bacterium]
RVTGFGADAVVLSPPVARDAVVRRLRALVSSVPSGPSVPSVLSVPSVPS